MTPLRRLQGDFQLRSSSQCSFRACSSPSSSIPLNSFRAKLSKKSICAIFQFNARGGFSVKGETAELTELTSHRRRRISSSSSTLETVAEYPWLQGRVPRGFWLNMSNQRRYMLRYRIGWVKIWDTRIQPIGTSSGTLVFHLYSTEHRYRVSNKNIIENYGSFLLVIKHSGSASSLVNSVYPDFNLLPWLFDSTPRRFFKTLANRKLYIDWLMKRVSVNSASELQAKHFEHNPGGWGLLKMYQCSPQRILDSLSPPNSNSTQRPHHPKKHWSNAENQRAFLDSVGSKFGVQNGGLDAWFRVTSTELLKSGGAGVLSYYNNSMYKMLRSVYPNHSWSPWKFDSFPKQLIHDTTVLQNAVTFAEKELGLSHPEDWYRVSKTQLATIRLDYLISQNGGLYNVLKVYRPNFDWDKQRFAHSSESTSNKQ